MTRTGSSLQQLGKVFFALILVFFTNALPATAQNISGIWHGELVQRDSFEDFQAFQLTFYLVQKGDALTGSAFVALGGGDVFEETNIEGKIADGKVRLMENTPMQPSGSGKCIGVHFSGVFTLDAESDILAGELSQGGYLSLARRELEICHPMTDIKE